MKDSAIENAEEWDVDSERTEYEPEEQWRLRRGFLLQHRDRFSRDRLVCLAQVFTNIEFLGCRYPEQTMQEVAALSEHVAAQYRASRRDKLKRTFVQASDAAEAKAKRTFTA